MIPIVIPIVGIPGYLMASPSIADDTVIGGVIMPSANIAAPPNKAGNNNHFLRLLTKEYNEKIPPSPLLSARSTSIIYLIVVWMVKVQKTRLKPPITTL
jgi:hypothetical protein